MKLSIVVILGLLTATYSHAGIGSMSSFTDLVQQGVTWLQAIGLIVACGGLILAGMRYVSGEHDAKDRIKSALIGASVIAGASLIMEFIKTTLGTR
jgi:hypothetical protein